MESTTDILQESAEASVNEVEANVSGLVQYLQEHIPDMVFFGIRLLIALLIFVAGRFLIRWIRKSVLNSFIRRNADPGVPTVYRFLFKVSSLHDSVNYYCCQSWN